MASNHEDASCLREFQLRLLRGLPQPDLVLQAYADILSKICDQYDTPMAGFIINSTSDFINFTSIEPKLSSLSHVHCGSTRFPCFLRDRTGLGIAVALLMFPKTLQSDFTQYIEALPDMAFWVGATNDLLS